MYERFTDGARKTLVQMAWYGNAFGHEEAGTVHLLVALFDEPSDPVTQLLHDAGVTRDSLMSEVGDWLGHAGDEALAEVGSISRRFGLR